MIGSTSAFGAGAGGFSSLGVNLLQLPPTPMARPSTGLSPDRFCSPFSARSAGRGGGIGGGKRVRGVFHSLVSMQTLGSPCKVSNSNLLLGFSSTHQEAVLHGINESGAPPFCIKFSHNLDYGRTVAVADEDGNVLIISTTDKKFDLSRQKTMHCHNNAIFDICWSDDDTTIATASGDQSVRLWDVERSVATHSLRSHKGSVKSVRYRPHNPSVLVTGARDGTVMLWDTRVAPVARDPVTNEVTIKRQFQLSHSLGRSAMEQKSSRPGTPLSAGRSASRNRQRKAEENPQSVTSTVFLDENVLASATAADGGIKLWDIRGGGQTPCQLLALPAERDGRRRGVACMATHSTRSAFIASSTDHNIYMFDSIRPEAEPRIFSGHLSHSFYVKCGFSPCGDYIVSGSSDNRVYIWDVDSTENNPVILQAHNGEVSDVDWSADFTKLASSSDDGTVRLWSMTNHAGVDSSEGAALRQARRKFEPTQLLEHFGDADSASSDSGDMLEAAPLNFGGAGAISGSPPLARPSAQHEHDPSAGSRFSDFPMSAGGVGGGGRFEESAGRASAGAGVANDDVMGILEAAAARAADELQAVASPHSEGVTSPLENGSPKRRRITDYFGGGGGGGGGSADGADDE